MRIDLNQLEFIDKNLRNICSAIEKKFDVEFTITSLYRINDQGVHGTLPLRGIDLRCKDFNMAMVVCNYVNQKWKYNPNKPHKVCAIFHDIGLGVHIHLQTHPNTRLI